MGVVPFAVCRCFKYLGFPTQKLRIFCSVFTRKFSGGAHLESWYQVVCWKIQNYYCCTSQRGTTNGSGCLYVCKSKYIDKKKRPKNVKTRQNTQIRVRNKF